MSGSPLESPIAITNPIQAASEVFYKPRVVFETLAQKDNWSWIPFVIVVAFMVLPSVLYFNLLDTTWYIDQMARASFPQGSPAEIENFKAMIPEDSLAFSAYFGPIAFVIIFAIYAAVYAIATRNDETNVQGYTDWYGAMWWISMPMVVNGLLACVLIATQEHGAQISSAYLAPLSVAFVMGMDMTTPMFNFWLGIRLDMLWSIVLAGYCVKAWTGFSMPKSLIVGALPFILGTLIGLVFAM